ncbi:tyrosine-type recombinase/integrase [Microbacterium sp. APC 3901]|uniref:tyrosine-type recombinase/integrase n=1 Tax=Microbacterium sp. APC 3901 TaxID=3035192 RepID=UPI0025B56143|nr:tyrosine-type recombinase/integrase [Microbacterium sp. APC 3901]MDN3443740.1 tyrosine-type recombinase/integrase [Microbacterium sp. APC 3901]
MEKPQKLASGNWRQRYKGPDGKRYSATDTTPKKARDKALLELARMLADHADGTIQAKTRTRFDTFAEDWLQTRRPGSPGGYAPSSYRKRLSHLSELNRTFGAQFIEDITPADVRAWWNTRASTPSYRNTLFWFLHAIFEVAMDDELIQRNPVRVRGASEKTHRKRPTFTDRDVENILDAAEGDMKIMVTVLSWSALRIGELLALDWSDVEFLESRLDVVKHLTPHGIQPGTKTGEEHTRTIDLAPWALAALEGLYADSEGQGAIFRNVRGGRLSVDSAERRFRAIREKAGLEQMHLHDLRHVALSAYARQPGVTLTDLMAFGGHLSERVAMGYQHADDERSKRFAAEAVTPRWVKS